MNAMQKMKEQARNLPVFKFKNKIFKTVTSNPITLIVGETGSGKTTQIPQYLLEWHEITTASKIVCTQPRTVAAQSVAQRVSEEQGVPKVGDGIVGYHIRLDRQINTDLTKLEYMTEGVLLRKAMSNDNLSQYKIVIIDEAHERTVNADLLMAFLKQFVEERKNDLHVIIMSATLDTERFAKYFNNPPIISVPGSTNPVQHHWLTNPTSDYKQLTVDLILSIHKNGYNNNNNNNKQPDGHILVFLTGQKDIEDVCREVKNSDRSHNLVIYPLYSALSTSERKKAFCEPDNEYQRKCVVATNIAETSLTINNIVYVIDCGLSKQKIYSPSKGLEVLGIRGISKASVMQRIGRAGRVRPGIAYHLYTQLGYKDDFTNETSPEILRSGLVNEILSMLALGIQNPLKFDFIDAPNPMTMARALHILLNLGAIDNKCKITLIGKKMARLPVNPRMAKALLSAAEYNCVYEIIVIAAMLEIEDRLWIKPRDIDKKSVWKRQKKLFYHGSGDHITLLNIYNAWNSIKCENFGSVYQFCKNNFLKKKQLERADGIKKQIENNLADLIKSEQKGNDNNNNNNNNNYYGYGGNRNSSNVIFNINQISDKYYYDNIIKSLLSGYFMNIAVKGFKDKYWRFRLLNLGNDNNNNHKAIDVIDKAVANQNSVFGKNNCFNWIIFNEVTITHVTQLKILSAIKPEWLKQIDSNMYYDLNALSKDHTPISRILKQYNQ